MPATSAASTSGFLSMNESGTCQMPTGLWTDSSTMQNTGFPDRWASLYELDDGAFEYVFQPGIVPLPFIEEMGDCGTVAGAVFFKINGLPMISKRKDGYQYGHDMFHDRMWKDPAQT